VATGPQLTFQQIMDLWNANGGPPGWAPLMAGIAIAESGGNTTALNNTPATGDYSVGLWQINYYDGLLASRTNSYGSPAALQADPNLQAKAAISLFGGGPGITNWQNDPTWKKWIAAGSPSQPSAATVLSWTGGGGSSGTSSNPTATGAAASGPSGVGGSDLSGCKFSGPSFDFLFFKASTCLLSQGQWKAVSGAIALASGVVVGAFGVILLASTVFNASGAKQAVGKVVSAVPGPAGQAAKLAGSSGGGAARKSSTRTAGLDSSATPPKAPAPTAQPKTAGRIESRQIERRYRETERQQGPIGPRGGSRTSTRVARDQRQGRSIPGPGSAERRRRAQQPF
jgi:hypothetical protein